MRLRLLGIICVAAAAATSAQAGRIITDPSEFEHEGAETESFEDALLRPGVTQPFPATPGLLAPPPAYPSTTLIVLSPDPNEDENGAPIIAIHDYSVGDPGALDLGDNGVIDQATQVPFGSAFLASGSEPAEVEFFDHVQGNVDKIGFYVVASSGDGGGSGEVTIELIRGTSVFETYDFSTLSVDRWSESFFGVEGSGSFHSVRISAAPGTAWALDGYSFTTVPEPASAQVALAGALLLYGCRRR